MDNYDHVLKELWSLCDLSKEERKAAIMERGYVPHPVAREVLASADALIKYPKRDFPRIILLTGSPGSGKTTIMDRFEWKYPPPKEPLETVYVRRLLRINVPSPVDLGTFSIRILKRLGEPYNSSDRPTSLLDQAYSAMQDAGVLMLALDEFHNLFSAKALLITMMNVVRDICNELAIALLVAGTQDAEACIVADEQLKERSERHYLRPWTETQELRNFLASLEARLPLRRCSNLAGPDKLPLLVRYAEGRMNRMVWIVRLAACIAVDDESECVSAEHIRAAKVEFHRLRIDWVLDADLAGEAA